MFLHAFISALGNSRRAPYRTRFVSTFRIPENYARAERENPRIAVFPLTAQNRENSVANFGHVPEITMPNRAAHRRAPLKHAGPRDVHTSEFNTSWKHLNSHHWRESPPLASPFQRIFRFPAFFCCCRCCSYRCLSLCALFRSNFSRIILYAALSDKFLINLPGKLYECGKSIISRTELHN